ncbi:MAG: zinc-binding dehydrogenase [Candidatus Eremiobacter antarcticus]|nr:zinc-binding dehydrogenase [Candidatus Eremiobacteraeota bacterium]MBC5807518.1 zinc-binding dehydrogenase [Candidatus Eremiobacteraeota bacterium]
MNRSAIANRAELPAATRAAFYQPGGTISLEDVPITEPQAGELLVRVNACGLCASETLRWYADAKAPFALGHEPAAEIVACGDGARAVPFDGESASRPFAVGERVFIHHHAPCMQCRRCRRGDYVQCATWRATKLRPGGMSQLALVPQTNVLQDVLRIPADIDDDTATLIEPLATVVKSVRRSRMHSGDRVLVIGLGAMGMLHMLVARERGAGTIFGADRVPMRLRRAKDFGADAIIDVGTAALHSQVRELTGGEGAEIVFVTPGSAAALNDACTCVAPGGTIVIFTPLAPGELWPLDVHTAFFSDLNLVTSYSAGPNDTREAVTLLLGGLPVAQLFTDRFGLNDVQQAYDAVRNPDTSLKVIVYPQRAHMSEAV